MTVAKYGSLANVDNAVIHLGMNKKVLNALLPFQILYLLLTINIPVWLVLRVSPFSFLLLCLWLLSDFHLEATDFLAQGKSLPSSAVSSKHVSTLSCTRIC